MPSSDQVKAQPGAHPQASSEGPQQGCAAVSLQGKLHEIARQIGDADRHHRTALTSMQERLVQLGRQVDEARAGLPRETAGTLGRIEQGIAGLTQRITDFAHQRQAQRGAAGKPGIGVAVAGTVPGDPEQPWDAASAEALTRVHEMAAADQSALVGARKRHTVRPEQQATASAKGQATAAGQAWVEARLTDIGALLQRLLADDTPGRSLAALDERLDAFEQRLDAALANMAARLGREELGLIEAHVKELASHFEATSGQLARLDTIEDRLQVLARALEDRPPPHESTSSARLSDEAIEALIDSAAERTANRVAASMPAPQAPPQAESEKRIASLEGLLQDFIAERRHSEEATTGILGTIEDTLARAIDRVEAMATARSADYGDDVAAGRDPLDAEGDRLAEAYAAGARVLGQAAPAKTAERSLDAADYTPARRRGDLPADQRQGTSARGETEARQELRASAMRGKLKAQAKAEESPVGASLGEVTPGAPKPARDQAPTGRNGRLGLFLGVALLFGTGYLGVDAWMGNRPAPGPQTKADGREPGPRVQPRLLPTPARALPDRTGEERERASAPGLRHAASLEAPGDGTGVVQPIGLSPQAIPGLIVEGGPVTTGSAPAPAPRTDLPPAIGTAALRNAAASGDAYAELEVATRFAEAKGVPQDHARAFTWFERSAARGLAPAQFRLAACYEHGLGTGADPERARVWYRRAAEQGHARAAHNLAVLAIAGHGETQADYAAAAAWFRQAAERGLVDSQFNLGVLYETGQGVDRDLAEAYLWFSLAAVDGNPAAGRHLREVKSQLTAAELATAEHKLAGRRSRAAETAATQ